MIRFLSVLFMIGALGNCSDTNLSSSLKAAHVIENQTFIIDLRKSKAKLTSDFSWKFIDFVPRSDGYGTLRGSYRLRFYDLTQLPKGVSGSDLDEIRDSLDIAMPLTADQREKAQMPFSISVTLSNRTTLGAISQIKYAVPVADLEWIVEELVVLFNIRLDQIVFLDSYELPILSIEIGSDLKYEEISEEKQSSITSTFSTQTTLEAINQIKYAVPVVNIGDQEIRYSLRSVCRDLSKLGVFGLLQARHHSLFQQPMPVPLFQVPRLPGGRCSPSLL